MWIEKITCKRYVISISESDTNSVTETNWYSKSNQSLKKHAYRGHGAEVKAEDWKVLHSNFQMKIFINLLQLYKPACMYKKNPPPPKKKTTQYPPKKQKNNTHSHTHMYTNCATFLIKFSTRTKFYPRPLHPSLSSTSRLRSPSRSPFISGDIESGSSIFCVKNTEKQTNIVHQ